MPTSDSLRISVYSVVASASDVKLLEPPPLADHSHKHRLQAARGTKTHVARARD